MRLLHIADTHVGVELYGHVDPTTGRNTRLDDFAAVLDAAFDKAAAFGVHAVLFAGDAYRNATPTPTWQQVFARFVLRCRDAGWPVVMVAGNHDLPVTFGRATPLDIFAAFAPDRVTVCRRPELCRVDTAAGPLQVAAMPWPTRAQLLTNESLGHADDAAIRDQLEQAIRRRTQQMADQADPALPTVLLAHVCLADASFEGTEQALLGSVDPRLSTGSVALPQFDYVALGHVHRHQCLNESRPPVVYAGSPERIDFGEMGDLKGVCLVDIGAGASPQERTTTWQFSALPARAFRRLKYVVPAEADATVWLCDKVAAESVAGAVVQLRFQCTDEQDDQLDLRAVRAALGDASTVAGIVRERVDEQRPAEVEIAQQTDTLTALGHYLDAHDELSALKDDILTAGRRLEEQLTASEAQGA